MRTDPILDAFDRLAKRAGSAPLVADNQRVASRADVDAWAAAAAESLASAGAPRGSYALLACVNGAGFLAALLGARRAGLVPVLADWGSPPIERARVVAALGIGTRITCSAVFPHGSDSFHVERCDGKPSFAPDGTGYVKLTSGSSGAPSGVAIAPEALAADDEQLAAAMGLLASDRFVAVIPWSHSYALSSLVMPALRRGSMMIIPTDSSPWAPLQAARALSATVFPTVPVYLQTIGDLAAPLAWPETLRTVISAGAPLSPETALRFRERFGLSAHVFYGASESGGITYDRDGSAAMRGTVGTPIDGVGITLDGDGAVAIRGASLGLRHVPEQSDRLRDGEFKSADLAAWVANGELRLLGRGDALINVGGKKVQPTEVEAVLRAMPGVHDVFVLGVKAPGDGRTIVRAFVACDPRMLTYADVASWCRGRLAGHKVPRSIVTLEAIPRTARGKVDRAALEGFEPAPGR